MGSKFSSAMMIVSVAIPIWGVPACSDDGGGDSETIDCPAGYVRPELPAGETLNATCPVSAPEPKVQFGDCCSRVSNAERNSAPEFRVAKLDFDSPSSLAASGSIAQSLLDSAMDEERFNWLMQFTNTGQDGSIALKTGLGLRDEPSCGAGTFIFAQGQAPAPGDVNRWNPASASAMLAAETFQSDVIDKVTIGSTVVNEETGATEIQVEITIQQLELTGTFSSSRNCIGQRETVNGIDLFNTDAGTFTAYLSIADAINNRIEVPGFSAPLCSVVAGLPLSDCDTTEQSLWSAKPDSLCETTGCANNTSTDTVCDPDTTCNAWRIAGTLAAQAVEITN